MERNYKPDFPEKSDLNFGSKNLKPKRKIPTRYEAKDLYDNKTLAEERSYNIGCSGYRTVLVNASGQYKYAPCSSQQEYLSIMKSMQYISRKRDYYSFDPTDNIFDIRDGVNDVTKEGYNYKLSIFKKTLSNVIFRDPTKESILTELQRVVFALIETTKQVKNFFNYTVPSNNKRVF